MYHFDWSLFWYYIWPPTAFQDPLIRAGLVVTIVVSIIAQALGVVFGLFAALGQMSKFAGFRWLAEGYAEYSEFVGMKKNLWHTVYNMNAGPTPGDSDVVGELYTPLLEGSDSSTEADSV